MLCAPFGRLALPFLVLALLAWAFPAISDRLPAAPQTLPGAAAERVAAAVALRVTAQSLQTAACEVHSGIAPEAGQAALASARREMAFLLDALEYGNPARGLGGPETRRLTLRKLHDVRAMWEGMRHSVNALIADGSDAAAFEEMGLFEGILHDTTARLASEISAQYANPFELMQVDAVAIAIAGQQAVLVQRIALGTCRTWMHAAPPVPEVDTAMAQLSAGLAALHEGHAEIGIRPAPTLRIATDLAALRDEWSATRPLVEQVLAGSATPAEVQAALSGLAAISAGVQQVSASFAAYSQRSS